MYMERNIHLSHRSVCVTYAMEVGAVMWSAQSKDIVAMVHATVTKGTKDICVNSLRLNTTAFNKLINVSLMLLASSVFVINIIAL